MKTQFKVGDRVFSYLLQAWGEVIRIDSIANCAVVVYFPEYGKEEFTLDGNRSPNDNAPDLFFDEVSIEPPKKPLEDKDIVLCWNNGCNFERRYRFYDAENNCAFTACGKRNGLLWDNMVYVPDEEVPQELVAMRDKLED